MERDTFDGYLNSPQSQNPYAYVMNNPADLVDPTGMCGFRSKADMASCLSASLKLTLGVMRSNLKFCGERGNVLCVASIQQTMERLLQSVRKEMQWLGDDYHWTNATQYGSYAATAFLVVSVAAVLAGGGPVSAIALTAALTSSGGLTAATIVGRGNQCKNGSNAACLQFWSNTVLSGSAAFPNAKATGIGIGPNISYGPVALAPIGIREGAGLLNAAAAMPQAKQFFERLLDMLRPN